MSANKKLKFSKGNTNDSNLDENCRLITLPSEVLQMIFNFLSPLDLLSLEKLGFERINSAIDWVTQANFHLCFKFTDEDIKAFFKNTRVYSIKKLNFQHSFCFKPVEIKNIIKKCKHLKVLSIKDCGLTFFHLDSIFSFCSLNELEELSWDVRYKANYCASKEIVETFPKRCLSNIKRAHFDIYDLKYDIRKIISKCSNLQSLTLNLRFDSFANQEITSLDEQEICLPNLSSLIVNFDMALFPSCISFFIEDYFLFLIKELIKQTMFPTFNTLWIGAKFLYRIHDLDWVKVDYSLVQKSSLLGNRYHHPTDETALFTSFQIKDELVVLYVLSQLPDSHVSALGIIILETFSDELITCIQRACGTKLRHFALHAFCFLERIVDITTCMSKIFCVCTNITVLELNNIHFALEDYRSPFHAISMLKHLRRLCLSACSFFHHHLKGNNIPEEERFTYMVEKCNLIEEFYMDNCGLCQNGPIDAEMDPICNWENLKYLFLENIKTFRTMPFLKKIADNCLNFQNLILCMIGHHNVCHFRPALHYLIEKSSNLTFLRINHTAFNLDWALFWNAIGKAQNLKGLCLLSKLCVPIPGKIIINELKKLKNFSLFHLSAPQIPSTLPINIKKMMTHNGIIVPKLNFVSTDNFHIQCNEIHFDVRLPNGYP